MLAQPPEPHVRADLDRDLLAELESAALPVLRVLLDQEPSAVGMESRVDLDHRAADRQDPGYAVQVAGPQF